MGFKYFLPDQGLLSYLSVCNGAGNESSIYPSHDSTLTDPTLVLWELCCFLTSLRAFLVGLFTKQLALNYRIVCIFDSFQTSWFGSCKQCKCETYCEEKIRNSSPHEARSWKRYIVNNLPGEIGSCYSELLSIFLSYIYARVSWVDFAWSCREFDINLE